MQHKKHPKFTTRIGQRVGAYLTIISDQYLQNSWWYVKVKCSCGSETVKRVHDLFRKRVKPVPLCCGNKDCDNGVKVTHEEACINELYSKYKRGAKERNLKFDIDKKLFKKVITKPCVFSGEAPSNKKVCWRGYPPFYYGSIDRIDNKKGYIPTNIQPCTTKNNFTKGVDTVAGFVNNSHKVSIYQIEQGNIDKELLKRAYLACKKEMKVRKLL
jgi:hypothetical protein